MVCYVLIQLYLLVCVLFLAGKDATSFRLKELDPTNPDINSRRIKRWHRDGVVLHILFTLPFAYYTQNYWILAFSLLLRLSAFDIAFNKWAGLDYRYLGSTATFDQFFSKIFGRYGAVKKSLFFLGLLVTLNIILCL